MKRTLLVIGLMLILVISACDTSENSTSDSNALATVPTEFAGQTNPLEASAASEGATVYKDYCMSCHGEYGHGDGVAGAALDPKPKNLAELQTQVGDDYLFWRISTGKEGTSMVAWKGILTDEQIWQVVAFIRMMK